MGDVGYRGVSADQDGRYRNKEQVLLKKLASSGQFPPQFDEKVNMSKVNYDVMKPWISEKVSELLGFEDDVVVEYIHGMLEDPDNQQPDPRKMQLSLTGFLESNTPKFMAELWTLLLSAQTSLGGIPQEFVERKKQEMREAREKDANAIQRSGAIHNYHNGSRSNGERQGRMPSGNWAGGRERHSRFDYNRGLKRDFVDKSGTRTEKVQDHGWGARAARSDNRSDPYPYREREWGGRDRSREMSPYRHRSRSPYDNHRRSSPPPSRRRRDPSLTPEKRRARRGERRSPSPPSASRR